MRFRSGLKSVKTLKCKKIYLRFKIKVSNVHADLRKSDNSSTNLMICKPWLGAVPGRNIRKMNGTLVKDGKSSSAISNTPQGKNVNVPRKKVEKKLLAMLWLLNLVVGPFLFSLRIQQNLKRLKGCLVLMMWNMNMNMLVVKNLLMLLCFMLLVAGRVFLLWFFGFGVVLAFLVVAVRNLLDNF